jgi:hypothetical protein
MGKRIIQQRRGRGGHTYKVREKASTVRPGYLSDLKGEFECIKLIPSAGHSVPIAKFMNKEGVDIFDDGNKDRIRELVYYFMVLSANLSASKQKSQKSAVGGSN